MLQEDEDVQDALCDEADRHWEAQRDRKTQKPVRVLTSPQKCTDICPTSGKLQRFNSREKNVRNLSVLGVLAGCSTLSWYECLTREIFRLWGIAYHMF